MRLGSSAGPFLVTLALASTAPLALPSIPAEGAPGTAVLAVCNLDGDPAGMRRVVLWRDTTTGQEWAADPVTRAVSVVDLTTPAGLTLGP